MTWHPATGVTRLDLSKVSIPDAQLIQRGLFEAGYYSGTLLDIPAPKTPASYDAYWADLWLAEVAPVTQGGTPWMKEADRWLGLREIPSPKHHSHILG